MARKKNERSYTTEEELIRTRIHRLNERIRYTFKKYGANSNAYEALIHEAKKLVIGVGEKGYNMSLEDRKNGLQTIPETFGAITRMSTALHRRKSYQRTWNDVYNNFNPMALIKREIAEGGYNVHGKMFKTVTEASKFLDEKVSTYKFMTELLNECLNRHILGSSEVNAFVNYRASKPLDVKGKEIETPTHVRYFDKYINENPYFDKQSEDDLEDFADFVRDVIHGRVSLGDNVDIDRASKLTMAHYTDKMNSTSIGINSKKALQHDKSVDEYLKLAEFINKK